MSVELESKNRIDALIAAANTVTGGNAANLTTAVSALIAGFGQGGGTSGVKVTEYAVTEDADRSLWLNEQKIKLVKGVNIIATGWLDNTTPSNNRTGLTTIIVIIWGGTAGSSSGTLISYQPVRGWYGCTNGYNLASNFNSLCVGNTSKVTVDEDGLLTFTTSATEATIGNYNNSFIGAGNIYYLLQAESGVVC